METSTENKTENMLETVLEKKPVSVYSVSFAEIVNDAERDFLIERATAKKPARTASPSRFSKAIFNWRNAIAVGAILAVAVLHFAFQLSFIQLENSQHQPIAEVPAKIGQLIEQPADNKPVEFEKPAEFKAKKADVVMPEKSTPQLRQRQVEATAPARPQARRKEAGETRTERLRRAERILTGV